MPGTRLAGIVAIALAHAVALGTVYWLTVRTVTGREFEDAALRGGLLTGSTVADTVDLVLDIVSAASLMGALAIVALIALVRLARVTGLAAIGVMVASNGTTWLLKEHLLQRPDLELVEYTPATLNSFPSGHSTAVFSAVAAVLLVLPHRVRLPVATAGGVFAVVVAVATMAAGWHRPGDAVAAFLVVGGWTAVAAAAVVVVGVPGDPVEPPATGARWFGALALGCVLLALMLVLALDAAAGFRDSAIGQAFAFVTGGCLVVGAATGVLLVILRVLELVEAAAGVDG